HAGLRSIQKFSIPVSLQQRKQPLQRSFRIADESNFNRISQSNAHRVQLELNRTRVSWLGKKLDVGEGCSNHKKSVAVLHGVLRRLRPEQPDGSCGVWACIRH